MFEELAKSYGISTLAVGTQIGWVFNCSRYKLMFRVLDKQKQMASCREKMLKPDQLQPREHLTWFIYNMRSVINMLLCCLDCSPWNRPDAKHNIHTKIVVGSWVNLFMVSWTNIWCLEHCELMGCRVHCECFKTEGLLHVNTDNKKLERPRMVTEWLVGGHVEERTAELRPLAGAPVGEATTLQPSFVS